MTQEVVTMIHVPDVGAAINWYLFIGFKLLRQFEEDGEVNWAKLSFGDSEIMFSIGGKPSDEFRREFDLYIKTNGVDEIYNQIKSRVEIVEEPHDTFYGMREFIIRDLNRFWITFGQPISERSTSHDFTL